MYLVHYVLSGRLSPLYLPNGSSYRKSKGTFTVPTFDFVYWGTFSARNKQLFINRLDFTFWSKSLGLSKNVLLKKFSNANLKAFWWQNGPQSKSCSIVVTHHLVFCAIWNFSTSLKILLKFHCSEEKWNFKILKNYFHDQMPERGYSEMIFKEIWKFKNFY